MRCKSAIYLSQELATASRFNLLRPLLSGMDAGKDFREYIKFMVLKYYCDDIHNEFPKFVPSPRVNAVWNAHLHFPIDYSTFCRELTLIHGCLVVHNPLYVEYRREYRYEATLEAYRDLFQQTPPNAIWPTQWPTTPTAARSRWCATEHVVIIVALALVLYALSSFSF